MNQAAILLTILLLISTCALADQEFKVSTELMPSTSSDLLFLEIASKTPVFVGNEGRGSDSEVIFITPQKLRASFKHINQFRIRVSIDRDSYNYLNSLGEVLVTYPNRLVGADEYEGLSYDKDKPLDSYEKYLLEKSSYTFQSQMDLYGSVISEDELDGTNLHFKRYYSMVRVAK